MESPATILSCPKCHVPVRPIDYFCYNCGTNLHPKPLSISIGKQISLYMGSIFLAPMGIIWGFKYLFQTGTKAKIVGTVCIILTVVTLIYVTIYTINFMNTVQEELHMQLQNVGY